MGGAIIQLVAYGSQNIYLTGDPQVTFWKSVYKRYTNFSTESIQQDIIGNLAPGNYVSVVMSRNGDLLKGITLQYNPSAIYNSYLIYTNGSVPSNLGNTLFKQIEIEIGGNLIDRQYGLWLTIWSNLTIQSYIAPPKSIDTELTLVLGVGEEPNISTQYARMSYNHSQVNTLVDYNYKTACLYSSSNPDKFRGLLSYHVNSSTTIPTSGTFNLQVDNINELVNFDNPLNLIFLFFAPTVPSAPYSSINYFVNFSGVTTAAGITTFNGCQPYSPSAYPVVAKPIGTEYSVCSVFEIYTGAINPNDYAPAGLTNIIPDNSTTSFNIRINNPTNIFFYSTKATYTIYAGGTYYNIQSGSPVGKTKYFSPEGYLVVYDCEVFNPPVAQISLVNTDLVVPTGTYYGFLINDLLYFDKLINVIPTSGTTAGVFSSPFDVFTELNINGPLPFTTLFLVITEPINGRSYDFGAIPYIGTTIYNPVTQLFYYIATDATLLNGFPSVPVEMPNGTNVKSSSFVQFMNSAPSEAYIPLQFWFCRNPGLALPLIALQYHEIKLNLQLATWQELHAGSYSEIDLSSIKVYAEYVYLDSVERRHFTNNAHEYLIEQLQFDTFNNSFANNLSGGELQIDLNFSNCVKEIVFCGTPIAYGIASQGIATPNDILNSKAETSNVEVQLKINQANRFSNRNIKYFTRNQIWDCHTGSGSCNGYEGQVGTDNIGIYSFSLRPEEHQPSGTCNFSRISKPQLVFSNFNLANGEQINSLNIYATSYNILRIMSGMGNIAYAY
jgi:hypothetical protein